MKTKKFTGRYFDIFPLGIYMAIILSSLITNAQSNTDIQITEYMYSGGNGEYVEITNTGNSPIDLTGWSYSDAARVPGGFSLSDFGILKAKESVIFTEATASAFRTAWGLSSSVKVLGGNTVNLGRADEINIYDNNNALIDRLTYGDAIYAGTIRTQNISGWAELSDLATQVINSSWKLSVVNDAKLSFASSSGDIGNPGTYFIFPGLQISQSGGNTSVAEGGSSDSYTINLKSKPLDTVRVNISHGGNVITNVSTIIFTDLNWNTPQTVAVSAIDDSKIEGTHSDSILHTIVSNDISYNALKTDKIAVIVLDNEAPLPLLKITEYMYSGNGAEYVELTNVGSSNIDLSGWSFSNKSKTAGAFMLTPLGVVKPGESVIITDGEALDFKTDWKLCNNVKVLGGNTQGIGRNDELNIFDQGNALVDALTYNDAGASPVNGPRTQNFSAWPSATALGKNTANQWTLSSLADSEGSYASVSGDIGSPGKSKRATVTFDVCFVDPNAPIISFDAINTSNYADGGSNDLPAISGTMGKTDPTDVMRTIGINLSVTDLQGVASTRVTASSSNTVVVPNNKIFVSGSGTANINIKLESEAVGYTYITVTAADSNFSSTYTFKYAASLAAMSTSRFHAGKSDASTTLALDSAYMLVGDDEDQKLRIYNRHQSGLPVKSFDFSTNLGLTPSDEVDIEASTRVGNTIYWLGSHTNTSGGADDPDRERIFTTTISNSGENTNLTFGGYYKFLAADLVTWDNNNGHGLGAKYFNFAEGAAGGLPPENLNGFSLEGLSVSPKNNSIFYLGFRAPIVPPSNRTSGLIVPLLNLNSIVNTTGGTSGSAIFGSPIIFNLDGRGIRSIECNSEGCLIMAGNATSGKNFKLYKWTGNEADKPVALQNDLSVNSLLGGANDGSLESIMELPSGSINTWNGRSLQLIMDNGDDVYYGDAKAAKDLPQTSLQKFRSDLINLQDNTVNIESEDDGFMQIYPNPFHKYLKISSISNSKIEIFNEMGSKIYENHFGSGEILINLESQPEGIYLLKITSGSSIKTRKLIKTR